MISRKLSKKNRMSSHNKLLKIYRTSEMEAAIWFPRATPTVWEEGLLLLSLRELEAESAANQT